MTSRSKQSNIGKDSLSTDLTRIKGIGNQINEWFAEKGIETLEDLANTNPDKIMGWLADDGKKGLMKNVQNWCDDARNLQEKPEVTPHEAKQYREPESAVSVDEVLIVNKEGLVLSRATESVFDGYVNSYEPVRVEFSISLDGKGVLQAIVRFKEVYLSLTLNKAGSGSKFEEINILPVSAAMAHGGVVKMPYMNLGSGVFRLRIMLYSTPDEEGEILSYQHPEMLLQVV
jgi:hypothetical protein